MKLNAYNMRLRENKKMRAILIDVENKQVSEVEISDKNFLMNVYDYLKCDLIDTAIIIDDINSIYVDDEGLLKEQKHFFTFDGRGPFAGNGLISAIDDEGNGVATQLDIEEIRKRVSYIDWTDPNRKPMIEPSWKLFTF